VNCHKGARAVRLGQELTAHPFDDDGPPQHATGGAGSQCDDDIRANDRSFAIEPPATSLDLIGIRAFVQAALAAGLELEVFDRIGHECGPSVDAGLGDRAIENATRRADERQPGQIFIIAGLLADEHHARAGGTLSGHDLRGVTIELAAAALRLFGAETLEGSIFFSDAD
jgi:hypothetical protein